MVPGVLVHGDSVRETEVTINEQFWPVPVANKLGIPLLYKTRPGTGGDDSHIRNNIIVRLMADPDDGFAPAEWQYGGRMGPAPPVMLGCRDGVPFSQVEWDILAEFMANWMDELCDEENRNHVSVRLLTPENFRKYVMQHKESRVSAFLCIQFPVRSIVVAEGLSISELNDQEGEVVRYSRDRVGVKFPGRDVIALRPERLKLIREPPVSELSAKTQHTGTSNEEKQGRQRELARQEAFAISKRFVECMGEDVFPEIGDLHLFGLGNPDYKLRNSHVLGVWQGAVKHMGVEAVQFADALEKGRMPEFFEETCRKLAEKKGPNQQYAKILIDNKFAAVEWESL